MKQVALGLNLNMKRTRKREFLEQMERVVPWAALVALIAPYYPEGRTGRPAFALETLLRTHFLHVWTRRLLQAFFGDFKTVWTHVYGLLGGQDRSHARSLDEIRALRP